MNELLQKHGCSNVFSVPEGLKELMSDISREVLRIQPKKLLNFIANYLSALLITREHGIMAMKILEDLCDCKPTVSEHLLQLGIEREEAEAMSEIIKNEIEGGSEPAEGKGNNSWTSSFQTIIFNFVETIREYQLLKKLLMKVPMDEVLSAKVCQVARNAYRDYWYRKKLLKQGLKMQEEEPWEIAARNTLNLYKKTKPSITELNRATQRIQAAYKGYHIRRHVLQHLLPQKDKKRGRKVDLTGPPLDIAGSRDACLGPVINIRSAVEEDNMADMFDTEASANLGVSYDIMKTITHVEDEEFLKEQAKKTSKRGVKMAESLETSITVLPKGSHFADETPDVDTPALSAAEEAATSERLSQSFLTSDNKIAAISGNRISFSEVPPEIIGSFTASEFQEVPEEQLAEMIATQLDFPEASEQYQEIPEDIQDEPVSGDDITDSTGVLDTTTDATDMELEDDGEGEG